MMKTTVGDLVLRVSTSSPIEQDTVRYHIEKLDDIDSRFSRAALRLFLEPRVGREIGYVIPMLREYLVSDDGMRKAVGLAVHRKSQFDMDYSAPLVVLENATAAKSVSTMNLPEGHGIISTIRKASKGDFNLTRLHTVRRPDLMEASFEELNRYYRPIAVAGVIINIDEEQYEFTQKAPAFLAWASTQPKMDELLMAALRTKSLDPSTIAALTAMQKTTPQPLHNGLI